MILKKYSLILTTIFIVVLFWVIASRTQAIQYPIVRQQPDTLIPGILEIKPEIITVQKPKGKFFTDEVAIYNKGGRPINLLNVSASCFCGSAKVLNSILQPGMSSKILISINTEGVYDNNNIIEFYVESNAKNSSVKFKVVFLPEILDSIPNK